MKVIFISRSNSGKPHAFIKEQADTVTRNFPVDIQHFLIKSGGIGGYSEAVIELYRFIKRNKPDIIHVHYGLWAMVAVLNKYLLLKKYKIIITFHGSDIYDKKDRPFSLLGAYFSSHNILVSERMVKYLNRNCSVIPCGVDVNIKLHFRNSTRKEYGWSENHFAILFSSSFDRKIKDPEFAFNVIEAFSKVTPKVVQFIELKGYAREQLTALMQAADALIMCSVSEGSPQVIKEAILNSLPVISNNVGDVLSICAGVDNCYVISKDVKEYVKCLLHLSQTNVRIENRNPVIEQFDNNRISEKLYSIYSRVLK